MSNKARILTLALVLCGACRSDHTLADSLLSASRTPAAKPKSDAGPAPSASAAADGGVKDASAPIPPCVEPVTSDKLPARAATMAKAGAANQTTIFTGDLFNLFRSHCGGCHVDNALGGLRASLGTFPKVVTQTSLERILSNDAARYMPPPPDGKPFSQRPTGDPVVELATLLEQWLAAGSPADSFVLVDRKAATQQSPYQFDSSLGMALTNLGSCIPPKEMLGRDADRMAKMDKFFADAKQVPENLSDTDLNTFDSAILARQGVIGYAPAYPLWTDGAKKLRAVRVPKGQAITFDVDTQLFTIPPNTRFYKTFLTRVVDDDGSVRYRKMETRLIVSRPDDPSDGLAPHPRGNTHALFGTYIWNDAETEAVLLQDPLRDGTPWRDHLWTYVTDVPAAKKITDKNPANVQDALQTAGLTRTYAAPSSERCWECHQGSDNLSFVLGFTPLQVNRRPVGEGGVIEPTERDELSQLQRLMDYGVIKGIASPADVVLLEDSQPGNTPRNDYELKAQGYMVGNCAHCHNPSGYAISVAPDIDGLGDFRPSSVGGIFQLPLGRFSPRVLRSTAQDQRIPYITPSVLDLVPADQSTWKPKVFITPITDGDGVLHTDAQTIFAPWRSLIYRLVDAPFSYSEDSAIYRHMPMDTPGFDCRVRRLFGDWMVSIPALWKMRNSVVLTPDNAGAIVGYQNGDTTPQPYEEIMPDSPDWQRAQEEAATRVRLFEASLRSTDCSDSGPDIVDPDVIKGRAIGGVPGPFSEVISNPDGTKTTVVLGIPGRPHYAVTDLTEPPGAWAPRRPDWKAVLVDRKPGSILNDGSRPPAEVANEVAAVDLLQSVTLSAEIKSFALTDRPFGLWQQKAQCDFSKVKKLSDYASAADRPRWMDPTVYSKYAKLTGSEPVYDISPGAVLFESICGNCHGPAADSKGRVAAIIADMTGGETRVANLRDGLFGPTGDPASPPGHNITRIFGVAATASVTENDWAARYSLWMGLGGTQRMIPPAIQIVVGNTPVLGAKREAFSPPASSGNMLTIAQTLCASILPGRSDASNWHFDLGTGSMTLRSDGAETSGPGLTGAPTALIESNGDYEMWRTLCTLGNPLPVRVVELVDGTPLDGISAKKSQVVKNMTAGEPPNAIDVIDLYSRSGYPANTAVADELGQIWPNLGADVKAPWCVKKPTSAADLATAQVLVQQFAKDAAKPIPFCPDALFAVVNGKSLYGYTRADSDRWLMRGAMNAGLAVYLYLEALTQPDPLTGKPRPPTIPYTNCEALSAKP